MNYTTRERVRRNLDNISPDDNDLLDNAIASASRIIDTLATGVSVGADNYFTLEDIVNQEIYGQVNQCGYIVAWLRKATVNSIASFEYRLTPAQGWVTVATTEIDGNKVIAFTSLFARQRVRCRLSYNGGIADDPEVLPGDLLEMATLMAVRLYREGKSSLSDAIGVAELGQMQYTKAMPARFMEEIKRYKRVVAW
jgi:hypothetical protein